MWWAQQHFGAIGRNRQRKGQPAVHPNGTLDKATRRVFTRCNDIVYGGQRRNQVQIQSQRQLWTPTLPVRGGYEADKDAAIVDLAGNASTVNTSDSTNAIDDNDNDDDGNDDDRGRGGNESDYNVTDFACDEQTNAVFTLDSAERQSRRQQDGDSDDESIQSEVDSDSDEDDNQRIYSINELQRNVTTIHDDNATSQPHMTTDAMRCLGSRLCSRIKSELFPLHGKNKREGCRRRMMRMHRNGPIWWRGWHPLCRRVDVLTCFFHSGRLGGCSRVQACCQHRIDGNPSRAGSSATIWPNTWSYTYLHKYKQRGSRERCTTPVQSRPARKCLLPKCVRNCSAVILASFVFRVELSYDLASRH